MEVEHILNAIGFFGWAVITYLTMKLEAKAKEQESLRGQLKLMYGLWVIWPIAVVILMNYLD
ncbi:MAG: hypothetical protein C9356_11775 [Oleiphilus sp.]|nr:MAG: hypothetical protein C9356_11775 [Oleiphilus sp.]